MLVPDSPTILDMSRQRSAVASRDFVESKVSHAQPGGSILIPIPLHLSVAPQLGDYAGLGRSRSRPESYNTAFWGSTSTAERAGSRVLMEPMAMRRLRTQRGASTSTMGRRRGGTVAPLLNDYDGPQLGGFFKSLKKIVKKVAAPIAHIGAAVLTGGASLAVSAKILADQRARKAQAAQSSRDAAEFDRQTKALQSLQLTAPAAAPLTSITSIAPMQPAVQQQVSQAQQPPSFFTVPSSAPVFDAPFPEQRKKLGPVSGLPSWAVPAGLGAAGLLAAVVLSARRGKR